MILQRVDGSRFSRVDAKWVGKTVACIATGSSLTLEQCEILRAREIPAIGVNDAYLLAPWVHISYFADMKWLKWQNEGCDKPELGLSKEDVKKLWAEFSGQKCTISLSPTHPPADKHLHALKISRANGMSTDPETICTGSNSGYQALNIATLSGSTKIVLIGYDGKDRDGRAHFFGDHPDKTRPPYPTIKERFRVGADWCRANRIRVVNCSPGTALDMFETGDLESILASS